MAPPSSAAMSAASSTSDPRAILTRKAVRTEGRENGGVDHAFGGGAARRGDHQNVAGGREVARGRVIGPGDSFLRRAAAIGDRQAEGFGALRNGLADAAEAEDAQRAAAQRGP